VNSVEVSHLTMNLPRRLLVLKMSGLACKLALPFVKFPLSQVQSDAARLCSCDVSDLLRPRDPGDVRICVSSCSRKAEGALAMRGADSPDSRFSSGFDLMVTGTSRAPAVNGTVCSPSLGLAPCLPAAADFLKELNWSKLPVQSNTITSASYVSNDLCLSAHPSGCGNVL
jgi:hypothetical protein